jgi:hypothetical protein
VLSTQKFNTKIDNNKVDFRISEMQYIRRLEEILNEVSITIEEFESLIRLRNKSNHQFHKGSQTRDEANIQLESFPDHIYVKGPLKKVLKALEIWENSDN